jgi:hypothetical protein
VLDQAFEREAAASDTLDLVVPQSAHRARAAHEFIARRFFS